MLRYHMGVVTRDATLKRAVKRLTLATGSTADFVVDVAGLAAATAQRPVHMAIFDARDGAPEAGFLDAVPAEARVMYIIEGDGLLDKLELLSEPRATSLFCHDARFDDDEFISNATKALRGEIFGLAKCFPWGVTNFNMTVKNYEQKGRAIEVLTEYASLAGCRGPIRDRIQLVADELVTNAMYHAPVDAEGREVFAGSTLKELAKLDEVSPIQIQYGCSGRYFGLSVRDGFGSLKRARLLDYLQRAKKGATIENRSTGAGLGIVSILRSVSKLIYNLDEGHSTEAIALLDMELQNKGIVGARSLHVFQAAPHPKDDEAEVHEPAPPPRASVPSVWYVAAGLAAVTAFVGGIVVMRHLGPPTAQASGETKPVSAAQGTAAVNSPETNPDQPPSLTVHPTPAGAVVKVDGTVVGAGAMVRLPEQPSVKVTVERDGCKPSEVSVLTAPGPQVMHVALACEVSSKTAASEPTTESAQVEVAKPTPPKSTPKKRR